MSQDAALDSAIRARGIRKIRSEPSRATTQNEDIIQKNWDRLDQGLITPKKFVDIVKYRVGGCECLISFSQAVIPDTDSFISRLCSPLNALDIPGLHRRGIFSDGGDDPTTASLEKDLEQERLDWLTAQELQANSDVQVGATDVAPGVMAQELSRSSPWTIETDHDYAKPRVDGSCPELPEENPTTAETETEEPKILVMVGPHAIYQVAIDTLDDGEWLDDKIIDAYLYLIVERSKENAGLPTVFAFGVFFLEFYEKKGYDGVKNWTAGVDIFTQDLIFVPVHLVNHWCMVMIDVRVKEITYMDSLYRPNDECPKQVLNYLKCESLHKRNTPLNVHEWKIRLNPALPRQKNSDDCGVFALKFADFAARNSNMNFSQTDMPSFRRQMRNEILNARLW